MTTEQDPASGDDLLRSYMNKLPQAAEDDPDDLPFESASGDAQDALGGTQSNFLPDEPAMPFPAAQPLPDAPPALPSPRPPLGGRGSQRRAGRRCPCRPARPRARRRHARRRAHERGRPIDQ